jgi:mRNA interferase MazF
LGGGNLWRSGRGRLALPTRGEVWWCELDPTRGFEIQKTRPAVVLSSPVFDTLAMRIIIPLTSWQAKFAKQLNKVFVKATTSNGLENDSAADFLQIRAVSVDRFKTKIGRLEAVVLEELAAGVAIAVEYRP